MVHIFLPEVIPKFCLPMGMWDMKEPHNIPNCGNRYIITLVIMLFSHVSTHSVLSLGL